MLTDYQNSFTTRLSSKFPIVKIKYPTTPQMHSYTNTWKINVRKSGTHWSMQCD